MGRQSALPGIFIESMKIETKPFDKRGVIQEFVGRGVIRKLEPVQEATEFTEDTVQDFIESAADQIGPFRNEFRIKYNLLVRTFPSRGSPDIALTSKLQQRFVRTRSRIFARLKNPFEPRLIHVSTPVENPRLSGKKMGDIYDVTVTVTK